MKKRKRNLVANQLVSSGQLVENPFVSEAQRRACYAKQAAGEEGWDCSEWEGHTPKGKKLPERKKTHNAARRNLKLRKARRAGRVDSGSVPLRSDPSRTGHLQQQMILRIRQQFAQLKGAIVKFIGRDNALGLPEDGISNFQPTDPADIRVANLNPYHDDRGRFATAQGGASTLRKKVFGQGGFTYKPIEGRSPKSGVVVSLPRDAGWEMPVKEDDFRASGKKIVLSYLKKVRDAIASGSLDAAKAHVGAWLDVKTGRVVLDVNEVYTNRKEAENVGRKRQQDAIYDIGTGQEIDLRGPGGKRPTGNIGQADWSRDGRGVGCTGRAVGGTDGRMSQNAFCPTGPGGGVDPSCSPSSAHPPAPAQLPPMRTIKIPDREGGVATVWENPTPEALRNILHNISKRPHDDWAFDPREIGSGALVGMVVGGNAYVWENAEHIFHGDVAAHLGIDEPRWSKKFSVSQHGLQHYGSSGEAAPEVKDWAKKMGMTANATVIQNAYNPQEVRDERGRWASGGAIGTAEKKLGEMIGAPRPIKLYHGTSAEALEHIKVEGLRPHAGHGADDYALENGGDLRHYEIRGRKVSVYMTSDPGLASDFANMASMETGTGPALVKVAIPADKLKRLKADELTTQDPAHPIAFRYEGRIRPEWIIGTAKTYREAHELLALAAHVVYYLVIPCSGVTENVNSIQSELPQQPTVAIDFDGRIAEIHPKLDLDHTRPRPGASSALNAFRRAGIKVIVWTARNDWQGVADWMRKHDIPYDDINANPDFETGSRKITADLYLDDRGEGSPDSTWPQLVKLVFKRLGQQSDSPHQPTKSKRDLFAMAPEALSELLELLDSAGLARVQTGDLPFGGLESRLAQPGSVAVVPPVKSEERAVEKVNREYGGDWSRLLDVVRCAIACDNIRQMWDAVGSVDTEADEQGMTVVREKDRFAEPLESGYRDLLQNIQLPCGMIAEIQFNLKPIILARERQHMAYSVVRTIRGQMEKEGRRKMTEAERLAVKKVKGEGRELMARAWAECRASDPTLNRFCATGKGGGVDPHCGIDVGARDSDIPRGIKGFGTKDDPFRCGANIHLAAKLLSKGYHIRLRQPDQVATLIDEMQKMIRKAVAAGKDAPRLNLCEVTVKGTNLFCEDNIGIPRVLMPQLSGIPRKGSLADSLPRDKKGKVDLSAKFVEHLRDALGVKSEVAVVKASHLRASQSEIDGAKVAKLIGQVEDGKRDLTKEPIIITRSGYVVDGHHHWAAAIGVHYHHGDKDLKLPVVRLDMDIGRAISEAKDFADAWGIQSKTIAGNAQHQFQSIQFDAPETIVSAVRRLQGYITPADVIEYEDRPHVTLRYGLHDGVTAGDVEALLRGSGVLNIVLGGLRVFQSPDADVLVVDAWAPQLERMHEILGGLPHTDTHPSYNPHMTIAYLRSGAGKKFIPYYDDVLRGRSFTTDQLTFSDQDEGMTYHNSDVPNWPQEAPTLCGAAQLGGIIRGKYGLGPETQEEWADLLDHTKKDGVNPFAVVEIARKYGLEVEAKGVVTQPDDDDSEWKPLDGVDLNDLNSPMTLGDLSMYTERDIPVMCVVQDYGGGYWLTVLDVLKSEGFPSHVLVQDSSWSNARKSDSGEPIEEPGRKVIPVDRWNEMWHDEDGDGRKFVNFGIAIGPLTTNAFCPTGKDGGQDNSCSAQRHEGGKSGRQDVEVHGEKVEVVSDPNKEMTERWLRHSNNGMLKGLVVGGQVHVFDAYTDGGRAVTHENVGHHLGDPFPSEDRRFIITLAGSEPFVLGGSPFVHTYSGLDQTHPAVKKWIESTGFAANAAKLDPHGGALPTISREALEEADFITMADGTLGTNCSNCEYVRETGDKQLSEIEVGTPKRVGLVLLPKDTSGTRCTNCVFLGQRDGNHICTYTKIYGQLVTGRNTCRYWDGDGAEHVSTIGRPQDHYCSNPASRGMPVTNKNCCDNWDQYGSLRSWKVVENVNYSPEVDDWYVVNDAGDHEFVLNYRGQPRVPPGSPEGGQFTGGQEGGGDHLDAVERGFSGIAEGFAKVEDWTRLRVSAVVHKAASDWVRDGCDGAASKLPAPIRTAVKSAFLALRLGVKVGIGAAFSGWHLNQALAERVAKERGMTDEQARRFRGAMSAIDLAMFKPAAVAASANPITEAATWIIPPMTGAYLAYSTARHPLAVMKAARSMVMEAIHGTHADRFVGTWSNVGKKIWHQYVENAAIDNARVIADALGQHHFDDWYIALLSAAIDAGQGHAAIPLADHLYEKHPNAQIDNARFADEIPQRLIGALKRALSEIGGMVGPDYQRLFYNEKTHRAWWESADGDDNNAVDTIKRILESALTTSYAQGWDNVSVVSERSPSQQEPGWVMLYPEERRWSQEPARPATRNTIQNADGPTPSAARLKAFQKWLKKQLAGYVVGKTQEQLWQAYVEAGWKKGGGRAFDDYKAKHDPQWDKGEDFYNGSKQQFLNDAFNQPVSVEKAKLMAAKTFSDLKGVTDDMSVKMVRILTDAVVQGWGPHKAAKALVDQVGLSQRRAELIAKTEMLKVHNEAQLLGYEALGVEALGVLVEFTDAGDDAVCEECLTLSGTTYKPSQAHGILPVHPACRCIWTIGGPLATTNAFCPTGAGGGVVPTCSPTRITQDSSGSYRSEFDTPIGKYEVEISRQGPQWVVKFSVQKGWLGYKDYDLTWGAGSKAVPIMRRVGAIVDKFISERKPERLMFSASSRDLGRVHLYDAVAPLIAARHGYILSRWMGDLNGQVYYGLTRKKEPVRNNSLMTFDDAFDVWHIGGVVNVFCPTGKGGGVDATCSPEKSEDDRSSSHVMPKPEPAPDKVPLPVKYEEDPDKVQRACRRVFGREVTKDEFQDLCGIRGKEVDGAEVEVSTQERGTRVVVSVRANNLMCDRSFMKDDEGRLVCHNDYFRVFDTGEGRGRDIFARQVEELSARGFDRIETEAGRSETMNGYYTWPRLGYDAPIGHVKASIYPKDPIERELLHGANRVSDLMKTKAGREWWKENGVQMNMKFDLKPKSLSRKVLDDYLKEKGVKNQLVQLTQNFSPTSGGGDEISLTPEDDVILDRVWDTIGHSTENVNPYHDERGRFTYASGLGDSSVGSKATDPHDVIPSWSNPPDDWHQRRYGGVVFNDKGQFLLREPTNHYDGYHWSFSKGGLDDEHEHPSDTAKREVREEMGIDGKIVGAVPGVHTTPPSVWHDKDGKPHIYSGSSNYFFLMRQQGPQQSHDKETNQTRWADYETAKRLISQSTNEEGRRRDLRVLKAAREEIERRGLANSEAGGSNEIVGKLSQTSPTKPVQRVVKIEERPSSSTSSAWSKVKTPPPPKLKQHLLDEYEENAFCPTGAGGGQDDSCSPRQIPSGGSIPKPPKFISSQKANVEANEKAVGEMRSLAKKAAAGDKQALSDLKEHVGTPSPKVQVYKQQLLDHVTGKQSEPTKKFGPVPIAQVSTYKTTSGVVVGPDNKFMKAVKPESVLKQNPTAHSAMEAAKAATGMDDGQIKSAMSKPASPGDKETAVARAKITSAILEGGHGIKDAVLQVIAHHDPAVVKNRIEAIASGDVGRAVKEYASTPIGDLNALSKITVKSEPVHGQAVCNMALRSLTMGSTSVTGDFRHELGHALRSSWSGVDPTYKNAMTKAAYAEYDKMMAKVKADPPEGINLSHDDWETKYGAVGKRCLDNWEENVAEHYRLYHREIYRDQHEGGGGKYLAQYRQRHPGFAKLFDAHYTAQLLGME